MWVFGSKLEMEEYNLKCYQDNLQTSKADKLGKDSLVEKSNAELGILYEEKRRAWDTYSELMVRARALDRVSTPSPLTSLFCSLYFRTSYTSRNRSKPTWRRLLKGWPS